MKDILSKWAAAASNFCIVSSQIRTSGTCLGLGEDLTG